MRVMNKTGAGTISANKILEEVPAAISANLGNITEMSLAGNASKYILGPMSFLYNNIIIRTQKMR